MKPFRWNLQKREQLGKLVEGVGSPAYSGFNEAVQAVAAEIIARSEDATLAFVGRSPESLFDYLSGVVEGTSKSGDLRHLNISNRYRSAEDIESAHPGSIDALKQHFIDCELSPLDIQRRKRKTLFVDWVYEGGTFEQLSRFLFLWAADQGVPIKEFRQKFGLVGVTIKTKTSPNTWRWQQKCPFVDELDIRNIQNHSIDKYFWSFMGDMQKKVTPPNPPRKWLSDEALQPPRASDCIEALRVAYNLYEFGGQSKVRFAGLLAKDPKVSEKWLRTFIGELKLN